MRLASTQMIVIGLTGSVGMGKSTTAAMFGDEGVPVFDSDAAVHRLYQCRAVGPVGAAFSGAVKDGKVDRAALGREVIGNSEALRRLEAIVHPMVRDEREAFLAQARATGHPLVLLDIPLLYETGADAEVDVVVLASAPEPVQKTRVMARPGMTDARFAAILASQMPDAEKRRRARFIVETGEGVAAARTQVQSIIATLRAEAETRA